MKNMPCQTAMLLQTAATFLQPTATLSQPPATLPQRTANLLQSAGNLLAGYGEVVAAHRNRFTGYGDGSAGDASRPEGDPRSPVISDHGRIGSGFLGTHHQNPFDERSASETPEFAWARDRRSRPINVR